MTIGEFVYNGQITVYGQIVVWGHFDNGVCSETQKLYDSSHPKFQGKAIPDWICKLALSGVGVFNNHLSLHTNLEHISNEYL